MTMAPQYPMTRSAAVRRRAKMLDSVGNLGMQCNAAGLADVEGQAKDIVMTKV